VYRTLNRPLRAFDFFVPCVTDYDDSVTFVTVTLRLQMNLGYEWTGSIDNLKA
jgi:hypothetical protein